MRRFFASGMAAAAAAWLLVCTPIIAAVHAPWYFYAQFEDRGIDAEFPEYEEQELRKQFSDVLAFMSFRQSALDDRFFTGSEIAHMRDVRSIMVWVYVGSLTALGIIVLLCARKMKHALSLGMLWGGVLVIVGMVALLAAAWLDFSQLFFRFHMLLFPDGNWMFDPETSHLIRFLPPDLFLELTITLGSVSAIAAISSICVGFLRK